MNRLSALWIVAALLTAACGEDEDSNIYKFSGGKATPIITGSYRQYFSGPAWSHDGSTIVFIQRLYGWEGQTSANRYRWESDVWRMSPDGSNLGQVVKTQGRDMNPRWHPYPGVREVVFTTLLGTGDDTLFTIYTCDLESQEAKTVYEINHEIGFPSYTHDGTQIVFMDPAEAGGLYKVAVDGGEPEAIANSEGWGRVICAECSPAEPLVAFFQLKDGAVNVYTIAIDGGAPNQLTQFGYAGPGGFLDNQDTVHRLYHLSWFKDGSKLVVTHFPDESPRSWWNANDVMCLLPKAGGTPSFQKVYLYSPNMAPNGNKLVGENRDAVYVMEFDDL